MPSKCPASQPLAFVLVPAPNCQLSSWAGITRWGDLLAYLEGGGGPAWIARYKSIWPKVEAGGAGRHMGGEQASGGIRVWGWHRVLSRGKPQKETPAVSRLSFPPGQEVPGPQVSAGPEGAALCQDLPLSSSESSPWNPAGLELEGVLGISSSVTPRL